MIYTPPKKVLLIDDDEDDRMLFYEALKNVDATIPYEYAENGLLAQELLRSYKVALPDYIFLDINMPRLDGKEFLALIKIEAKLKHIPIVVFTTSAIMEDKDYAKAHGAAYFITKPTEFRDLKKVLSIVLENEAEPEHSKWLIKF